MVENLMESRKRKSLLLETLDIIFRKKLDFKCVHAYVCLGIKSYVLFNANYLSFLYDTLGRNHVAHEGLDRSLHLGIIQEHCGFSSELE